MHLRHWLSLFGWGVTVGLVALPGAGTTDGEVAALKAEIVRLANGFAGQADPDYRIQGELDPLVRRLVEVARPAPVEARLVHLQGHWRQVWGPYNYRSRERKVDPALEVYQIYQYVRPDGSYYNACVTYAGGDRRKPQLVVLRGEYQFVPEEPSSLRVRFTEYRRVRAGGLAAERIADVAPLFAYGRLPQTEAVVPGWVVRMFFSPGRLREVYTDADLRLLYGESWDDPSHGHLYVMVRAEVPAELRLTARE